MNRLLRRNVALWAPLVVAACGPLMAADELPKAETILDKYVEVTGGKAAYDKLHSEISSGTMEMPAMGIKGTIETYRAEPAKSYTELEIAGVGKIQEGYDGTVAWSLSAIQGAHVKEGEEKAQAVHTSQFHSEDWKKLYKKVETLAVAQVDGKDCYKVQVTPQEGPPLTQYFDKQSGLMVRMTMTVKIPMGDVEALQDIGDYRKEGDILAPHKISQTAAGQSFTITIDKVQYNTEIPKDKFDLPAEIQALLKK
jgi:hypothetical protein